MTMAKGKNQGSAQHGSKSKRNAPKRKKRPLYIFLALVAGVASLITGGYFLSQREKPPQASPERARLGKENIRRREDRPTLSPGRFTGKIREAYEIARAIPEVLDQLYCYCSCQSIGHKSLLSCYVDDHASA
jgi:hypothetical protein